MTKKQILKSALILIVLCFVCKFIYEEFKVDEGIIKTKLVITETKENNKKLNLYYTEKGINYYLYGLDNIMVDFGDHDLALNKALEAKQINMNFVLDYVKENGQANSYWDGGSVKYNNRELSVLKCQTLEGNSDYYFGPNNMEYKEGFCEDEPYICSFVRTYLVLDISESNDENYSYLTLREFQGEEVVTVKVKKELTTDMIEENYYEFKFGSLGNSEEGIKNIFDNNLLLEITLTDKVGLLQTNQNICK